VVFLEVLMIFIVIFIVVRSLKVLMIFIVKLNFFLPTYPKFKVP